MKKKTKAAEIWDGLGLALGVIYFMPAMLWESVSDWLNRKNKAKEPKPEPVKFVCSECGEIFTPENKEKAVQGSDGFSYYEPIECPKCHGMRTSPEGADISVYEKIWDMDELWTFIQDMEHDWDYRRSTVDNGLREYRCTECGTVFKARDIGRSSWQDRFRSKNPFPSRCPNCHQMKTLPVDENNIEIYKPLWTMLELAEQTKEARKMKKLLERVAFVF